MRGNTVSYGEYGLQSLESGWLSAEAIGRRLKAEVEQILDRFAERELELLVAHLPVFRRLHGSLEKI